MCDPDGRPGRSVLKVALGKARRSLLKLAIAPEHQFFFASLLVSRRPVFTLTLWFTERFHLSRVIDQ